MLSKRHYLVGQFEIITIYYMRELRRPSGYLVVCERKHVNFPTAPPTPLSSDYSLSYLKLEHPTTNLHVLYTNPANRSRANDDRASYESCRCRRPTVIMTPIDCPTAVK